jgi:hypothetical protein
MTTGVRESNHHTRKESIMSNQKRKEQNMSQPNLPFGTVLPSKRYPFTLSNRVLVADRRQDNGVLGNYGMENLLNDLREYEAGQEVEDLRRPLTRLSADFTNGYMEASFLSEDGEKTTSYLVTNTAANHLSSMILPARFFTGLKDLAQLDKEGAVIASDAWNKFASVTNEQETRLVRTVRRAFAKNDIRRVIRSVHGKGYAVYNHTQFVEDMMQNGGDFVHMPILSWTLTDNAFRVRFAALDGEKAAFGRWDPSVLTNEPVPMVEAWNSETGGKSTGLRGGMFNLKDMTGFGHWDQHRDYKWIHRGSTDRIRAGVLTAFENLQATAKEVAEAFLAAREVEVEQPMEFVEEVSTLLTDRTRKNTEAILAEDHRPDQGSLAALISALALSAAQEEDLEEQEKVESAASTLLKKGLDLADKNNWKIPAKK